MNYIDYLIIAFLLIALIRGFSRGAIIVILDLVGFGVSIWLTILTAPYFELAVKRLVPLSDQVLRAAAFLVAYLVAQTLWSVVSWLVLKIVHRFEGSLVNRLIGVFMSLFYTAALVGILLILVKSLPLDKQYREIVERSRLAPQIARLVEPLRPTVEKTLKTAIDQVTKFITIQPKSGERLNLHLSPGKLVENPAGEQAMLALVNQERATVGVKALQYDDQLRDVARAHAQDMWQRRYFSHVSPDGQDPFGRLEQAKVQFVTAGENLALAPNLDLAHSGLMNSPGHRANILQSVFGRVGIGIISGPPYGEMVVQVFKN